MTTNITATFDPARQKLIDIENITDAMLLELKGCPYLEDMQEDKEDLRKALKSAIAAAPDIATLPGVTLGAPAAPHLSEEQIVVIYRKIYNTHGFPTPIKMDFARALLAQASQPQRPAPFVPPGYADETAWLRQQLKDAQTSIKAYQAVITSQPTPAQPSVSQMIDAAEEWASNYDGDDRDCIKTDVMNAFYAGIRFCMKAGQPAKSKPKMRDICDDCPDAAKCIIPEICSKDGGTLFMPAASQPAPAQLDGWKLVPVDPTKAMIDRAEAIDWSNSDVRGNCANQWNAMLAAAPVQEPAPAQPAEGHPNTFITYKAADGTAIAEAPWHLNRPVLCLDTGGFHLLWHENGEMRQLFIHKDVAAAPVQGTQPDAWKEAAIHECMMIEIGWNENDPAKTLHDLICWHVQAALDPKVSEAARNLIVQGAQQPDKDAMLKLAEQCGLGHYAENKLWIDFRATMEGVLKFGAAIAPSQKGGA